MLNPSVVRQPEPWVVNAQTKSEIATTPVGLTAYTTMAQGSSCLATLGFASKSRWDSKDRSSGKLAHFNNLAFFSFCSVTKDDMTIP